MEWGRRKKGNPSEPWKSIATPLPNAFKGFRFAPISLRETASPPLSAVAASLRRRRVGSGGMSDALSHQGNSHHGRGFVLDMSSASLEIQWNSRGVSIAILLSFQRVH